MKNVLKLMLVTAFGLVASDVARGAAHNQDGEAIMAAERSDGVFRYSMDGRRDLANAHVQEGVGTRTIEGAIADLEKNIAKLQATIDRGGMGVTVAKEKLPGLEAQLQELQRNKAAIDQAAAAVVHAQDTLRDADPADRDEAARVLADAQARHAEALAAWKWWNPFTWNWSSWWS